MNKTYNRIFIFKYCIVIIVIAFLISSCDENLLEKNPLDQLTTASFWKTENDALMGLTGVYARTKHTEEGQNFYGYSLLYLDPATDNGSFATMNRAFHYTDGTLDASDATIRNRWVSSYQRISSCNNFLENIENVKMDAEKKAELIAEVRFLRAYQYFWMSQFFGGVPLITSVITIEEANSQVRAQKAEIIKFVEDELTAAAQDLPVTRPANEDGRIIKGAALAMKGRLLMAEERWAVAASVYKEIIDMHVFKLHPNYKELFEDAGDGSKEIIYAVKYMQNVQGTMVALTHRPVQFGGWHKVEPFNDLVEAFDMIDGKPQKDSPLFDPNNPYLNKDPRLYATCFLPGVSKFQGITYQSHPDSVTKTVDAMQGGRNGLCLRKYVDDGYTGDLQQYGADFKVIRYAEILLSYLESKFEAGDNITQQLLDETVNLVRARVNMPPLKVSDISRERIRNERRVETAWEGLRYWDILRWKIAHIVCTSKITGLKLTNDPANYTKFKVDDKGYYLLGQRTFANPTNYLWPIPLTETDINPNLEQNPGY